MRYDIPKGEDRWKAESDARTLRESTEIVNDPERLRNAQVVTLEQINAMKGVVGIPVPPPSHQNKATLMKLGDKLPK